jgi:glycosyltransferase involved in cell wall biosynthesis
MTICMVNTFHYRRGGDSAYALNLEEGLRARGFDVASFAMKHPDSLPSSDEDLFVEHIDYPELMRRGGIGNALRVLGNSIYNRQARENLARLLDRRPCRMAHVHAVMHHLTAAAVLELHSRELPVVWTLHDFKSVCPTTLFMREGQVCEACSGGRFYSALRYRCKRGSLGASAIVTAELYLHRAWKVYEQAALLLAPSSFLRDRVLEAGLRPKRIEVLPNFVETDRVGSEGMPGGYALYVGRVTEEKGVETLMRAAADANVALHVVGTGEAKEDLEAEAASRGWDHVTFHGHRSGAELEELYRNCSVLAVPSECRENCPMVVLEAFAAGKPVLGSRLGGLVEILDGRGVGELVEPGSVEAWSDALSRWVHDAGACREAGGRAREIAEREYSPQAHFGRLLELYEQVDAGLGQPGQIA